MGKLASIVLGFFPSIQQELIDGQVNKVLCREYHDEILRLRNKLDRVSQQSVNELIPDPLLWNSPGISTEGLNNSTSDAWQTEDLRKTKRQQCKDLEDMYIKQLKTEDTTAADMESFYG